MREEQKAFLVELAPAVQRLSTRTGLPPSVVLAQAILESDWGRSELARRARNLFGIKAHNGSLAPDSIRFTTTEYAGDHPRRQPARFSAYDDYDGCLADYARLLSHPRYARARAVASNPFAFAVELQRAGYATDPHYAHKLALLIRRYRLTEFDPQPTKESTP